MRYVVAAMICLAPVMAQEPSRVLFTLPKPKKYKLPVEVQQILMNCMKVLPGRAELWRDEYKSIYEDKKAMQRWVYEVVMEARDICSRSTYLVKNFAALDSYRVWLEENW